MCINVKAETIDKLPSFRGAFEKRRCIVPAGQFHELRGPKARRKPLWIRPALGALLLFARVAGAVHHYDEDRQSIA